MNARVDLMKVGAGALEGLQGLERYLKHSGLDERLTHLIKLRASQINGCLYCCDMHTRDARLAGVPERKVAQLPAFEESSLYDEREKAALAWAESLTRIAETHAPDAAWERLRACFDEQQAADLTLLVGLINTWNRIAIGTRAQPPPTWPKLP
jgi:AhpD family alkylhydroperoxidase